MLDLRLRSSDQDNIKLDNSYLETAVYALYKININIDSDFFSNLDYCLCRSSNPTAIDLSILIVNLLYLKTKNTGFIEIINEIQKTNEQIMGN